MTYTIKFVNFTLGALFQNNLGRWWGSARSKHSMVAIRPCFGLTKLAAAACMQCTAQRQQKVANTCLLESRTLLQTATLVFPRPIVCSRLSNNINILTKKITRPPTEGGMPPSPRLDPPLFLNLPSDETSVSRCQICRIARAWSLLWSLRYCCGVLIESQSLVQDDAEHSNLFSHW